MTNQIKITIDRNGNIIAEAPAGTSPEAIAKAKADFFAEAKAYAAKRKAAVDALDAEFLKGVK